MWRKEETNTQRVPEISTGAGQSTTTTPPARDTSVSPISSRATACLSQGIKIRGEITGSEDLFIDGEVDGKLDLGSSTLTVGPNGRVKADVTAREVVVRGRVEGKISGRERVQLWSTAHVIGEVTAQRLAIEDGGVLRGKVETGKRAEKSGDAIKTAPKPQESKKADAFAVPVGPAAD